MKQEKSIKQHPLCGEGINRSAKKSKHNTNNIATNNIAGNAGFIIAIICAFLSWTLVLPEEDLAFQLSSFLSSFEYILYTLISIGLLLSVVGIIVGMFDPPHKLTICGFIISLIDLVIFMVLR